MRLPVLKSKDSYKRKIVAFGGINKLQMFSEGEIYECEGISHERFPALTQRRMNELDFLCKNPSAAIFGNKECVVSDSVLYYDRKEVGKLSSGDKIIAQMGNKIVIFPDKMYYDTENKTFMSLEGTCSLKDIKVVFTTDKITVPQVSYKTVSLVETLVIPDEKLVFRYSEVSVKDEKIIFSKAEMIPARELSTGDLFSEKSNLQQYRIAEKITGENGNTVVTSECIRVEVSGKEAFKQFSAGDVVEISGCQNEVNNKQAKIIEAGDDYLLFEANTFDEKTETESVVIKRNIPDFSFVCTYKNRMWGCKGNTIYASALGDPMNYFKYSNLSSDSFTVESDTSGDFTAATTYGNCCLFFKKDKCYRLYGDRPANFQLVEAFAGGITAENAKSIADVDGKIIFKGNGGIYSFNGGSPQKISDKLGEIKLNKCIGFGFMGCYYLSAETENGREEFVFDTKHGLWSKSGIKNVIGYFSDSEKMYRLMSDGIYHVTENTDDSHEWYAEFCPFDESYYKTKNYSRLHITAQLFENSVLKTEISRDGGSWQTISQNYGNKKEYINIPCSVKGCHEVKIRLSGKGKSIVESVVREFSVN